MKRITFLLCIIAILIGYKLYAVEKGTQPVSDSTSTVLVVSDVKAQLKANLDALDDKFAHTLTREQREIQDAQKAVIVQYNMLNAHADSTWRVRK